MKLLILLSLFVGFNSVALDDYFKVTTVLSGDSAVFVDRTGMVSGIFHLAGCSADSLDSGIGKAERDKLSQLVLNREVRLRFYVPGKKTVSTEDIKGQHSLAQAFLGSKDVCVELIKTGLSTYKAEDERFLDSIENSAIRNFQRVAQNKRLGRWVDSVVGKYVATPDSQNSLEAYKYNQQYINGTTNPALNDFNRGKAYPVQTPSTDWRKKMSN